jgi:lipid kinase YegS
MLIHLIINTPSPAEADLLRSEMVRLRAEGHEVVPRLTFEPGDTRRMAAEAAADGADLVVAAGGDGTVNGVVNGIHEVASRGGAPSPRLGIIPLGTANDLAGALEIPMEVEAAMRVAVNGRGREVNIATVGATCFLNVSTGGFGADATEEAPAEAKRMLGTIAYVITGVRKFVGLEVSRGRFSSDRPIYDGPFLLYAVGNSGRTGGGNWLTPRADISDGLLDLCVVKEMSRLDFLKLLPDLRAGEHLDHPGVIYEQHEKFTVEVGSGVSVNADGEPVDPGSTMSYRVSRQRLEVMAP